MVCRSATVTWPWIATTRAPSTSPPAGPADVAPTRTPRPASSTSLMSPSLPALWIQPRRRRQLRAAGPHRQALLPGLAPGRAPRADLGASERDPRHRPVVGCRPVWAHGGRPGDAGYPAGLGQQVGGPDHHLRRNAPPVRALTADQLGLDPGHVHPGLGQPPGGVLAARTHPDHHDVGFFDVHARLLTDPLRPDGSVGTGCVNARVATIRRGVSAR